MLVIAQVTLGMAAFLIGIRQAGRNERSTEWPMHLLAVSAIVAGLAAAWAGFMSTLPVMTNVTYEVVERQRGSATIVIYGEKPKWREKCELLGGEPTVMMRGPSQRSRKAYTQWPRDPSPGSTRPPGLIDFGEWVTTFDEPPGSEAFAESFTLHHDCGPLLGLTHTRVGPFRLPGVVQ